MQETHRTTFLREYPLAILAGTDRKTISPSDFQGANPRLSFTLQSAGRDGGGRASCNAFTFYSPHIK
jgi:hypothetical protein